MARTARQILTAALLLPVLLFAVAGTSFASWRCRSDGVARDACCCPKKKVGAAAERSHAGPTLSSLSCCQVEQSHFDKAPSDLPRKQAAAQLTVVDALVARPVATVPDPFPRLRPLPVRAPDRERSAGGRLLVLQKQAFLI